MIVRGFRSSGRYYYVTALVICKKPRVSGPVTFMLDSAAATSAICDVDAKRLGIRPSELKERETVQTAGGVIGLRFLRGADILFLEEKGTEVYSVRIPRLQIIEHAPFRVNLLGMDVLQKFLVSFDQDSVYLKRREEHVRKK